MEDDLNFKVNGRRPQFFDKWKTTLICWQIEDDLTFLFMEDNFKLLIQEIQKQKQYQHQEKQS